jgi:hypothetical protein
MPVAGRWRAQLREAQPASPLAATMAIAHAVGAPAPQSRAATSPRSEQRRERPSALRCRPGGRACSHLVRSSLKLHEHLPRVAPVGRLVQHPLDLPHHLPSLFRHLPFRLQRPQQPAQQRRGPAALALDDLRRARVCVSKPGASQPLESKTEAVSRSCAHSAAW